MGLGRRSYKPREDSQSFVEPDYAWSPVGGDEDEKQTLKCGLLNFRPTFLQKFNTAKWFFAFFCLAFLVHHMTNTMISVNLSTIEKRFELSSTKSSFIINAYDVSCALTVMFISHFCRNHKPKWIGIGIIVMGIGALIFTIPHLAETVTITEDGITPLPVSGSGGSMVPGSESTLCSASNVISNATNCVEDDTPSSSRWYFIFVIGSLLFGLGGTPINALGPPFLDEIFPPSHVGAYYGIMGSMSCLGPIFGFAFGGFMLKYYVDFSEPEGLDPSHSDWVGAWWTGFIFSGVVAVMAAIPLIMFPRKLPESDKILEKKIAQGLATRETRSNNNVHKMSVWEMAKEFWPDIKSLLTNGAYMCCTLSQAFTGFLIGACTFLPKLVQIGLKFEPSQASFYLGSVLVTAAGGGYLIGGLMVKKLNMTGKSAAKYAFIFSVLGFVPSFGMLLHCPGVELGEPTVTNSIIVDPVHALDGGYGVNMCADNCKCPKTYDPVCAKDITFLSPCHAGCTSRELVDNKYYKFSNCSCLMTDTIIVDISDNTSHVVAGKCETICETYIPVVYLGAAFLTLFFCFLAQPASMLALNRSVGPEHLSMAYGIRNLLFRAVGTIPGPIAFGIIIDSACDVWQRGCDGSYGSCWEHDTTKLIYSVTAAFIMVKLLSDIMLILTWKLYPKGGFYSQNNSANVTRSNTIEDDLSEFVVKVTDDRELLEISYHPNSPTKDATKRLSQLIMSGLEQGKVFVAMAHETIV